MAYKEVRPGLWWHVRDCEDDAMPPPRRDYYSERQWKANPVPPGQHPYRFYPTQNEIDLHPSQWSRV